MFSNIIKGVRFFLILQLSLLTIFEIRAQVCVDDVTTNNWNNSWVSCSRSANPNPSRPKSHWVLYEFDQPQSIKLSHIWNANRNGESNMGIKEAIIDYSVDGKKWTSLGSFTFPKANERNDYSGFQGPDFNGNFVKQILITVVQTHGSPDCASLSEVQFNVNPDACYGEVDACGVCNGEGEQTWYIDQDGDGLGDPFSAVQSCEQPVGFVSNALDDCDTGVVGWATVGPIFQDNGCTGCHGAGAAGGLNLTAYATAVMGGNKCGTGILTGTTLVDIIMTDMYDGCGDPFIGPSMNDRVGGNIDANELALIRKWIEDGAPEDCSCPAGTADTDQDGVCDAIDQCPDLDNALIGTPCDDGLDCTTGDVWREDCNCKGDLIDRDNDGICDADDAAPDNPCTADGVVDGVEPAGWVPHPDNDCDSDLVSVASGDLDDFSACVDSEGTLMTAECSCGENTVETGGLVTDFTGMTAGEARAANGLPDGLFTDGLVNNSDTLVLQFPFMETGEEICLTVGFNSSRGEVRVFLNNRLMTFSNDQALNNFQPQEFCFSTLNTGPQTLMITSSGQGEVRVDGTSYFACPCSGSDITDVACLANFSGVGWRELTNCYLEICEGEPVMLGTDRYETLVYQWRGPNGFSAEGSNINFDAVKPSDSGMYWIYYQNSSGCDLIKLIELNVIPAPPVAIRVTPPSCGIQNGEILLTFSNTPNRSNIAFSISGPNGNYIQVADNLGQYVFSNLSAGDYDVWTRWGEGDCPMQLGSYTLVNRPAPTVSAGPDLSICEGESISLTAVGDGVNLNYRWNTGHGKAELTTVPTLDGYADQTIVYRVTTTDDLGCQVSDAVKVAVHSRPQALVDIDHPGNSTNNGRITFNFADHPNHKRMAVSLNGPSGNYQVFADNIGSYTFNDLAGGDYDVWLRWDDGPSCPVDLGIVKLISGSTCPEIVTSITQDVICEGQSVKLVVSRLSGATYTWSNGADTYNQIVTPELSKYANETFTYGVTVTDPNGCSRSDSKMLTVLSRPRASFTWENSHCGNKDGGITFNFPPHPDRNDIEFSINGRTGYYHRVSVSAGSLTLNNLSPLNYDVWVRWGDNSCAYRLGEFTMNDSPLPTVDLGPDISVCSGKSIKLIAKGDRKMNFTWSNGFVGQVLPIETWAPSNRDKTDYYEVVVTDQFGCRAKDNIRVTSMSDPDADVAVSHPHCGMSDGVITFSFKDHPDRSQIEFSLSGRDGPFIKVKDNSRALSFKGLSAGNYVAFVRWGDGSCPIRIGTISLEDQPGPDITAGPDQHVFEGDLVKLWVRKNDDWRYIWSNGVNENQQKFIAKVGGYSHRTDAYRIRVIDEFGCSTRDEVLVHTYAKPRVNWSSRDPGCGASDGLIDFTIKDHPEEEVVQISITGEQGPYINRYDDRGGFRIRDLSAGYYEIWARWKGMSNATKLGKAILSDEHCGSAKVVLDDRPTSVSATDDAIEQDKQRDLALSVEKPEATASLMTVRHSATSGSISSLQVYPNPTKVGSILNIKYFASQVGTPLKIADPTGRIIREIDPDLIEPGWNDLQLDLENLSTGTYIVLDGYGNYKLFVIIE